MPMRLVMLGTGPFGVPALRQLAASSHDVLGVVTRPPRGRGAGPAPLAVAATELGLPVEHPETVNCDEVRAALAARRPDLLIVCDYGEILKRETLAVARLGGINLHGSLLPKYRGAAPVQWAVLNGDAETGNTVIQMTPGLDAGPTLGVQRLAIDPDETAGELEARLAAAGAELVLAVVDALAAGTAHGVRQDAAQASRAPRLAKEQGLIEWSRPAAAIKNQVRALDPWPRAYTHWQRGAGEPLRLIVHRTAVVPLPTTPPAAPGSIVEAGPRLVVAASDAGVELATLQPAGKRVMAAAEFLRGYGLKTGDRLS